MTAPGLFTDPELSDLFDIFEEQLKRNLRVAMPAVVTVYDAVNQLVDVQPLILERGTSGAVPVPYPVLGRIPLIQPRTSAASVTLPVAPGDVVTLLFSDRDLSGWLAGIGSIPTEPPSSRKHDLSDCWAIIGGYPTGNKVVGTYPTALEVKLELGTKIAIHDGAGNELLTILDALITAIRTMTLTETGSTTATPPINDAAFGLVQDALAFIKVP